LPYSFKEEIVKKRLHICSASLAEKLLTPPRIFFGGVFLSATIDERLPPGGSCREATEGERVTTKQIEM